MPQAPAPARQRRANQPAESAPVAPDRAVYLNNLRALYHCDPSLATRIENVAAAALPALETTVDGNVTCQAPTDDGRSVFLHSRRKPPDEARALLRSTQTPAEVSPEELEGSAESPALLLLGIGLGYLLQVALESDSGLVIVAESNLGLLKAALCLHDVSAALKAERLIFITAAERRVFHERLRPRQFELLLGLRIVATPAAQRCDAEFYAKIRALLADLLAFARIQTITVLRNSRVTVSNVLMNLPDYLSAGIDSFHGCAADYPAIVVAAGPSLARHIERLRALRDRAVIIAVQTVLKPLLAHGVVPHFVTTLDFHEISARFFQDVTIPPDCRLVAEPKAAWQTLAAFRGERHVLASSLAPAVLGPAAPRRAGLRAGSTVAHLSFYLAEFLGCDPIVLIGQDLAYSDNLYYAPGMPIEQTWAPEMGRFQTIEMKQWERVARGRPIFRKVRDVNGREIYTDEQLFTYAEQFQADFARSPARVINAGGSGMQLDGAAVKSLDEVAREDLTRALPLDLFGAARSTQPEAISAIAEIEKRCNEIRELRAMAVEMSDLLARLSGMLDQPREFNRLIERVDRLRVQIITYDRVFQLVMTVSPLAELRKNAADRALRHAEVETPEHARRRLRRDREYVREFIDGCEFLLDLLPKAAERLRGDA